MIRNLITLPDGTEVFSGAGTEIAIKTTTLTECVNDSDELSLGSACANALEMTIFSPGVNLSLTAGDEVKLYKVDDAGNRVKNGIYVLEKPTRPTANTMKLTGYDRVVKLDKDLTEWLNSLTGWPYRLHEFAEMVCMACELTFRVTEVPNSDFLVHQFTRKSVTGRKIMKWLGEICCRFCRANANGEIEFGWYTDSGVSITPSGSVYYFAGGLSYEEYKVAPIDAVQLRISDGDYGALWPPAKEGANSYIIIGNAILSARVTGDLEQVLENIKAELAGFSYTPCKVAIPANLGISAGNTVRITDRNGKTITACVMTKTTNGQKDTLECTGSARRGSATASNNPSASSVAAAAAQNAFAGMTQAQVFAKLTDNGKIQGIYSQDNKWYINAEVAQIINLKAENIDTTNLKVSAAQITGTLTIGQLPSTVAETADIPTKVSAFTNDTGYQTESGVVTIVKGTITADYLDALGITAKKIVVKNGGGATLFSAGDSAVTIAGWKADSNSLYSGNSFSSAECFICTGSSAAMSIGGSASISGWVLKAGSKFGVTKDGAVYANNANITGKINATSGKIGGWFISSEGSISSTDSENGTATNAIWMEPERLVYMYNQSAGDGIITSWENVAKAGMRVGNGKTTTVTISGKTYTFTDGILTNVA